MANVEYIRDGGHATFFLLEFVTNGVRHLRLIGLPATKHHFHFVPVEIVKSFSDMRVV